MRVGGWLNRFFFFVWFYFLATIILRLLQKIFARARAVSLIPHQAQHQRGVEERCASDQKGNKGHLYYHFSGQRGAGEVLFTVKHHKV
jgi:hypothetical protein